MRTLAPSVFVPSSQTIKMTYSVGNIHVESAAGAGSATFFRLNSVYDPDATGVGTTATGYNTWSALFLNYKVKKVTVRVQGTVTGMATGGLANVTLAPVPYQPVLPANKQTWKLVRGARYKTLTNQAQGGQNHVEFLVNYDNAWVAEVTPSQYANDMDWSGTVGSNPARQNYLALCIDSINSATPATLAYNIQITYLVEWFNPVPIQ
jgi:hypothetical protein